MGLDVVLAATNDATHPLYVFVAFGAGIISFLSPCVLPIVPAYLSLITGVSVGEMEAGRHQGAEAHRARHGIVRRRIHRGVRAARSDHDCGRPEPVRESDDADADLRRVGDPHGAVPRGVTDPHDAAAVPRVPFPPPPRAVRTDRRTGGGRGVRARLDAVHRAGARHGAPLRGRRPEPLAGDDPSGRVLPRPRALVPRGGHGPGQAGDATRAG